MLQEQFLDLKDFAFLGLVTIVSLIGRMVSLMRSWTYWKRYMVLFLKLSSLEQQLLFIHRDSNFHKASSQELLDYINSHNLQSCFSEVFKRLLLNATFAISSLSLEGLFHA